jgi:hypothetical protein
MKKIFAAGLTLLLGGLIAAGSAFAAGQQAQLGLQEGAAHSASDLIGLQVQDQQGAQIGVLEDIMVDLAENQVAYGIVSVDGTSHIVPWTAFTSPHEGPFLILEADRQTVTSAPTPPSPGQLDQAFGEEVHEHFGVSPYWEENDIDRPRTLHPGKRQPWEGLPGQPEGTPGPGDPPMGGGR